MPNTGLDLGAAPFVRAALTGELRYVVSERPLALDDGERHLLSEGVAVGLIKVGQSSMVSDAGLDSMVGDTLITKETREAAWPGHREFWVYPIEKVEGYQDPCAVVYVPDGLKVSKVDRAPDTPEHRAHVALVLSDLGGSPAEFVQKKPLDETSTSFRARQRDPGDFVRMRTITISESPKVLAVIGPLKSNPSGGTKVQTYIFPKDAGWTAERVHAWLRRNRRKAETLVEKRGMPTNDPEGGVHAHAARRKADKTAMDGGHRHIYLIAGELVVTEEDGFHEHIIDESGNKTGMGGDHWHTVFLPEGRQLATGSKDSQHQHEMMVLSTALDGLHQHSLDLPTGETIKSLTPAEFVRLFPQVAETEPPPIRRASEILESEPEML
jgi:hypothetical protein